MGTEPKLDPATAEFLIRSVRAENPGREVAVTVILVEDDCPPLILGTLEPDRMAYLFAWLTQQQHEVMEVHEFKEPN